MENSRFKNYIKKLTPHRRACLVLLVFFVLFSLSGKIFSLFALSSYLKTALGLILPVIVTAVAYIHTLRPNISKFFRLNKIALSDAFLWFFLGICANCMLTVINIPINKFWSNVTILPQMVSPPESFGEYLLGVLCIAITPAIFEELFCRGIIMREYERYGGICALIFSALAFLVLHNSITNAVSMLLLGLMLAFIVLCSHSIFPAMIFHFAINFFSLTLGYISKAIIPPHMLSEFSLVLNLFFVLLALTFALVVISIFTSGIKKIGGASKHAHPKFGFSFSLIIIIFIYVFTQFSNLI